MTNSMFLTVYDLPGKTIKHSEIRQAGKKCVLILRFTDDSMYTLYFDERDDYP